MRITLHALQRFMGVQGEALPRMPVRGLAACLPGIALCTAIALASVALGDTPWFRSHGLSPLIIAMIAGAIIGNLFQQRLGGHCMPGISLSKQKLLRLGIILYGVRLTFTDVASVGLDGVLVDALVLGSTFFLALFFGIRILKMDPGTVVLIGAGSSICGAAAVLATEPVMKARPEQVSVAVATVVIFGTAATFLYPLLYHLNLAWHILPDSSFRFGLYAGSTIHEVAQVIAAARLVDAEAANAAVIAKMVRVMMLPVFLVALSAFLVQAARRGNPGAGKTQDRRKLTVPWFAIGFLLVVILNSVITLPQNVVAHVIDIDTLLLTMAMAALGLTTHASAFRQAGIKPMLLAAILFAWLVAGGAWINRLVSIN